MNSIELFISIMRNSPDFMEADLGSSLTPEPLGSELSELDLEEGFDMSTPEPSDSPYFDSGRRDITQFDERSIGGIEMYSLESPPQLISSYRGEMGTIGKTPPQYTPPPQYRRKSLPPPPSYDAHQSRVHRRRYWSHQQQRRQQGGRRTPPPSYDEAVFGHLLRDTRDFGFPQSPVECTDSNPSDFDMTGLFPDSPSSGDNSPGIFSSPTPDYLLPLPPLDGENLRRTLTAETPVESPPHQIAGRYDGWADCGRTPMEGSLYSGFPVVNSGETANVPTASSPVIERNSPNSRVEESNAPFGGRTVKENLYYFFDRKRGNNTQTAGGHYFLWQYLLEVLFTHDTSLMEWIGEEGEFVFRDPEKVSRGWFKRKNPAKKSNNDNYETMTRSIRYYYDRHMMAKVNGRKYTYKFLLPGLLRFVQNGGGMTDPEFLSNQISASEFDRVKNFVLTPSP